MAKEGVTEVCEQPVADMVMREHVWAMSSVHGLVVSVGVVLFLSAASTLQ